MAAVGRHHRRGAAASGHGTSSVVSFVVAMNRVDVVDLVVDLVDVNLDIDLVDVDLDVDLVDVDLVDILFVVLSMLPCGRPRSWKIAFSTHIGTRIGHNSAS